MSGFEISREVQDAESGLKTSSVINKMMKYFGQRVISKIPTLKVGAARFEVENILYNFLSSIRKSIESFRIILSKFGKHIK